MIARPTRRRRTLIVARYGRRVPGVVQLSYKDALALCQQTGGIIDDGHHAWRVQCARIEDYTSDTGAVVVTMEAM